MWRWSCARTRSPPRAMSEPDDGLAGIGSTDGYPDVSLDMVSHRTFDGRLQLLEYVPTVLRRPPDTGKAEA